MPDQVYDPLHWSKYLEELPQFTITEEDKVMLATLTMGITVKPEVIHLLRLMKLGLVDLNDKDQIVLTKRAIESL